MPSSVPLAATSTCRLTANLQTQSDGSLPPAADATNTAPDTARIQAQLNACATAANAFTTSNTLSTNGVVELSASGNNNAFLSGPLTMPGGVTLVIDKGVTLFASRDPRQYDKSPNVCGVITASDDGCKPLISNLNKSSNNAVMGPGTIDGQGGSPLYSTTSTPALLKRPDGSNMSWWDIGWEANAVQNQSQNNPRLIQFSYGYNFTLFNLTLQNAPKFHVVPSGVNGFTAWGVKIFTPTARYQAMNNYLGQPYSYATAKNTDGIDPASASPSSIPSGYGISGNFSGDASNILVAFSYINDGDDNMAIKGGTATSNGRTYNVTVAHDHFYTGHGMSIGSETAGLDNGTPSAGVLANVAPVNGAYPSVSNVVVNDLSFDGTDNGLRIKSDWSRGGLVANVKYTNVCMRAMPNPSPLDNAPQAALLFTPYYSPTTSNGLYSSFQNILVDGVHELSAATYTLQGFNSASPILQQTGWSTGSVGLPNPAVVNPLTITLNNVVADAAPLSITANDAAITMGQNVNLPLQANASNNVSVTNGAAAASAPGTVDCSVAFPAFPS
ncbi:glycoside hydrolase family 28 protein [Trinickia dinghuensis]|nr:glycosyl hydrolase family 28 protein [Trinickia dinghuensis]